MLANGSGEFSGTSRMRNPAATSASPTANASSGRRPRRIATSGSSAIALVEPLIHGPSPSISPAAARDCVQPACRRMDVADDGGGTRRRDRLGIERPQRRAAQDGDLDRPGIGQGGGDLGADQQPAEIAGQPVGGDLARTVRASAR